jgi:hypothetical protein
MLLISPFLLMMMMKRMTMNIMTRRKMSIMMMKNMKMMIIMKMMSIMKMIPLPKRQKQIKLSRANQEKVQAKDRALIEDDTNLMQKKTKKEFHF